MRAREFVIEAQHSIRDQIIHAVDINGGSLDDYFVRFTKRDHLGFSDQQTFGRFPDVDDPDFDIDRITAQASGRRVLWFYPLKYYLSASKDTYAMDFPYVWLVKLKPNAWLQTVRSGDREVKPAPAGKERVGILRMSFTPAALFFKHGFDLIGKFYDYAGQHQRHGQVKRMAEALRNSGYKEIEFVCANPEFPEATDPKLQKQMYAGLQQIPGVIPLFQDQSDWSEGQYSLTAIYKDRAVRGAILKLAKQLGVKVDLEQPVSDDYVDRAIRGEHEGQQHMAEGRDFDRCFGQACKLYDRAVDKNLKPKLVQVADFQGDGSGADPRWGKLPQHVWQHYVVIVGDQVLDPTAQQFGPDMPTQYPVSDLDRLWGKQYQIRPRENMAESLKVDVPNENWLQDKIDYAKRKGRNSHGVPYMGTTTAYTSQNTQVPVDILQQLPGMRGEQQNVRQDDLKAIMKIMKDTGKLPLDRGQEYAPFVNVAYNGEAWVNEGNHRIMAAAALGWKDLPVQISYFDGGERVESGAMYPGKIGLADVKENLFLEDMANRDPVIRTVADFYINDVGSIHKEPLEDYVAQAKDLLSKVEDKSTKAKILDIFKQANKNPYIQGGVITTVGALLAGGVLASAQKFGLSPTQTNMALQAILNTVIPTMVSRVNGRDWNETLKYTLASAGIGTGIAGMMENFKDGKNPQDKGDSARHGIPKNATIAQLKKIRSSKTASPRKKQLAHWQINMRQGKAKSK